MIRIITDSAADFELWELEKLNISCIPLVVMFNETEYRENVNLTKAEFYDLLTASKTLPKTAQASPQILLDLFEQAKATGDEAIYICLSSAISGTYQSAMMTRQLAGGEGLYVLDSRIATGGERMLVEYVVKLRDEGKSAAEIMEAAEKIRSRITLYACMNTLENLYRGGRISQTAYTLGTMAQIKPIIHFNEAGQVTVPAKAMGMKKGADHLCKLVDKYPPDDNFPFYVMYTSKRSGGEMLADRFRAMGYDIPDERIIQVGAAIGTHIGVNAIGFVYIAKE